MISMETAVEIALRRVPGQVERVELDTEDGILVYEVGVRTPYGLYEVDVNAHTGDVVKVEFDRD
jgi:uncharacterized membrane protein YkoI